MPDSNVLKPFMKLDRWRSDEKCFCVFLSSPEDSSLFAQLSVHRDTHLMYTFICVVYFHYEFSFSLISRQDAIKIPPNPHGSMVKEKEGSKRRLMRLFIAHEANSNDHFTWQ